MLAAHTPPLKILVVDDHDIVRLGVRHLLGESARVSDAASLKEAKAWLAGERFDLLLLDLSLGDDFGLAALPQLRESHPAMKIIVLTSMPEDVYAERAVRAGADGFVMKSALGGTLLDAVATVMDGGTYASPKLAGALLRRAAQRDGADKRPELSLREIEVLRLVAAGKTTREIADTLNRSVKTIETHKQSLKAKLGAETPAKLMQLALAWSGDSV